MNDVTDNFDLETYIGPVGKKELRQFQRAAKASLTRFEDELVLHLYDGATYYPIADRNNVPGRNHLSALAVVESRSNLSVQSLFANCLEVAEAGYERGQSPRYAEPSRRVVLGPLAIYTFEFDEPGLTFFRIQLSWLRSKGKKAVDCPLGVFYRTCSQWADFKGLTVCWSGHKSIHIHAVFDTAPYLARFAQPGENARAGMIAHWDRLEAAMLNDLGLTGSACRPDPQLKYPEQYRRLPNGLRRIDKDGHFLLVPAGMIVPQLTLWEMWRDRTSAKATALFHDPVLFAPKVERKRGARASPPIGIGNLTREQVAHCEKRLREVYPDHTWPRLARVGFEAGHWKAWFYNCGVDENPASILREDYQTICLQGRGSDGLSPPSLDAPLGECMAEWVAELGPPVEIEEEIEGRSFACGSLLARAFAAARSREEATAALDEHLPTSILYKRWLLIQANEGASKTTTIMRRHHWIVGHLARVDDRDSSSPCRQSLYAFGSYDEAKAKCISFNRMHTRSKHIGVVLPSFSRAYAEACRKLSANPITQEQAAQQGYTSLWAAVSALQPRVMTLLKEEHQARWNSIGDREPVWFTVHQVAHGWHKSTPTRLMAAKSFWSLDDHIRAERCRAETHLSLLVHDEIKTSTFVTMAKDEVRQWTDILRTSGPRQWRELGLDARASAFENLSRTIPPPAGLDFNSASNLAQVGKWTQVVTADTGEYATDFGDRDIYGHCHGNGWSISPDCWWREADAQRVVFLTTEEVPTAVAEQADRSIAAWRLDAPLLPRDSLDAYCERGVTGKNLGKKIGDWRSRNGTEWFAISNKLNGATSSLTHARARGSNNLIGKKIVQTMTYIHPVEYEQTQALNAWTGRDDLVLLRHIDECNQTAGRNLGFRLRPGAEHALLINPGLLKLIEPALGYSRYDFRIHETPNQRRTIKRKMSPPRGGCGATVANQANDNGGDTCCKDRDG